jgi:hypothetical protein
MKASKRYSHLLVDLYQNLEGQVSRTKDPLIIADISFIALALILHLLRPMTHHLSHNPMHQV